MQRIVILIFSALVVQGCAVRFQDKIQIKEVLAEKDTRIGLRVVLHVDNPDSDEFLIAFSEYARQGLVNSGFFADKKGSAPELSMDVDCESRSYSDFIVGLPPVDIGPLVIVGPPYYALGGPYVREEHWECTCSVISSGQVVFQRNYLESFTAYQALSPLAFVYLPRTGVFPASSLGKDGDTAAQILAAKVITNFVVDARADEVVEYPEELSSPRVVDFDNIRM